jgi:hypothetical protein
MVTVDAIVANFKVQIETAMRAALESAYSRFVNDCSTWARTDVEINTEDHARRFILSLLAGEDLVGVNRRILNYGFDQADRIRDLIWRRCADGVVKKSLEEKDKEIARLKEALSQVRF